LIDSDVAGPTFAKRASSYEVHPQNQTWNGITTTSTGTTSLDYTHIRHASPGVSCLQGSHVTVNTSKIEVGSVGVYAASPDCTISNSTIRGVNHGIITINSEPTITNTTISAREDDIQHIVK